MRRLNIFTMIFGELDIAIFVFYVYTISIFIKMKVSPYSQVDVGDAPFQQRFTRTS